jgi:hypothetical protein
MGALVELAWHVLNEQGKAKGGSATEQDTVGPLLAVKIT